MAHTVKERPVYRNLHITQLLTYRLVDLARDKEVNAVLLTGAGRAFSAGIGFLPGWFIKLVCLGLIWAYLHHMIAGLRFLWMDVTHRMSKADGRVSAVITLALSLLLTVALGAKLFGLF